MQMAAILWHVSLLVRPDRRALALGLVGLVRLLPVIFFSIAAGAVADAWDRRRVMLYTQSAAAAVAVLLAILTFRGLTHPWPIYLLAALGSAAGAFDGPARQAMLPSLVPREHLPNAISLNAIMFQIASVTGPSIGGLLIATLGVAWVYAFNALTFGCVIAALLMMRNLPPRDAAHPPDVSWRAVREGMRFVFEAPIIRSTMLLDFFATFFSSATALLPIFAQDILHVGARGYGWLYAAPSVGAVLMSFVMVRSIEQIERRGIVLLWAVAMYGAATLVFGLSRAFWLTFFCLGAHRRGRYREHGAAQCRPPARNTRPPARAHDRRQHGVLHGRPAAGRARGRRRGAVDRRAAVGGDRRAGVPHRNPVDRRDHARASPVSPQPR